MDGVAGMTISIFEGFMNGFYYTAAASSASGPTVDWDKTSKTGTFSMPGGNVELEPEYYPQATAVEGAVVSMENLQATVDAELVTFDANGLTGSTSLMYYVSETATAPAYDAQGWTDKVPNAKDFTEACNRYIFYYLVGDDEHSDGDICTNALTVTIAAAPTYAVTFAEGTDANEWTASPAADVTKGQTVTVTYTGSKKVLGVKAEKKAGDTGKSLAEATVGMIIGSNGKAYAADDKDNLPTGVTAVAKVCYVDGNGHGLALALADEGAMDWSTAQTACAAHTPAITGGTWKLATKDEWNNMITAAGSYTALRDGFSSVGGTNMQADPPYWSSTEDEGMSDTACNYYFGDGNWYADKKNNDIYHVRACLAF